jgi:hypothetical protein
MFASHLTLFGIVENPDYGRVANPADFAERRNESCG